MSYLSQSKTKPHNPEDSHCGQFLAYSDILGVKKHVLELGKSIMASEMPFEPIQNQTLKPYNTPNLGKLSHNDMLGIKKHIMKSRNFNI